MSDQISLSIENLSQRFAARQVFSGISARAESGETLVIAGPNGSGKSTLLKIIAGLLPPSGGRASVSSGGENLDSAERRRLIGYVSPDLSLYSELSGAENLLFFGRLRGLNLAREDLIRLLDRVGLKGRGRDFVGSYSAGMKQRLKFAFALMHEPPLLLLDEPTANLDSQGAAVVRSIVADQRKIGIAVIATNDEAEVKWGDRVVKLQAGG